MKEEMLESILDLNSNNVWETNEGEIVELWNKEYKEDGFSQVEEKLLNTIRLAFEVVHFDSSNEREAAKYEPPTWSVFDRSNPRKGSVAIRRRTISSLADLSYENIKHITAATLLELIDRNFGGGWDSIALSMKDIIETGFEISTTTLPATRIHAPGGTLEKKVADGFEVLEVKKGTWVEAIFAKKKAAATKLRFINEEEYDEEGNRRRNSNNEDDGEELEESRVNDEEEDEEEVTEPTEPTEDDTFYSTYSEEAAKDDEEEEDTEGLSVL